MTRPRSCPAELRGDLHCFNSTASPWLNGICAWGSRLFRLLFRARQGCRASLKDAQASSHRNEADIRCKRNVPYRIESTATKRQLETEQMPQYLSRSHLRSAQSQLKHPMTDSQNIPVFSPHSSTIPVMLLKVLPTSSRTSVLGNRSSLVPWLQTRVITLMTPS